MAAKPLPSQEVLRQLLDYDPETGTLTWLERDPSWFKASATRSAEHSCRNWNSKFAGKRALFHVDKHGYCVGALIGYQTSAHRVAWKIFHGEDPKQVDHINGNTSDNRLANLRSVTAAENAKNCKVRSTNTSGLAGISWHAQKRKRNKWRVKIGKTHIGLFDCLGHAIAARRSFLIEQGYHPNHWRR